MTVLDALQWDLSAVTPYSILDHILRTVNFQPMFDPRVVRKHAETFVALAATEYSFCHQSPMVVAVACLGAALRGLNPHGLEAMLSAIHLSCGLQMVSSSFLYIFWRLIVTKSDKANGLSSKGSLNETVCI